MKNTISNFIMLLFNSIIFAQTTTYTGNVVDTQQTPISYANVIALNEDGEFVKGVVTDDNGNFNLEMNSDTLVHIEISFMGFETQNVTPNQVDLGTIILRTISTELEESIIIGRKKLIEQKVDRLVFNAENSVASSNGSVIDLLTATPSVQVNNNTINIIGKSGVRILVNDRMIQLTGEELVDYLSSFSSDDVKTIEVITTPPAKYEAEGNGGLINIVLKTTKENSWSNQIRSTYIQTTYPAVVLGNTFNYNHNKWRIFASIDGKKGNQNYKSNSFIYYPDGLWETISSSKINQNYLSAKVGVDYQLTSDASIGFLYSNNYNKPNSEENGDVSIYDVIDQKIGNIDNIGSTSETNKQNILNLHYVQKLDTLGRGLSIDLDYFDNTNDRDRVFTSDRTGGQTMFQKSNNTGYQNIKNYSAKIDFELPTDWANLTYGGKITQTNTDNDVEFFDLTNGSPILDTQKSNIFEYKESIQALYIDATKNFSDKWQGKIGVRMENTQTEGFSKELNQTNKQKNLRFFPTIYLNYTKNIENIFNISYSRRIDRPGFSQLNPFRFYLNANSYTTGNPDLKSTINDSFELKYIFKNNFITSLFFDYTDDSDSQVTYIDIPNNIQIYKYENIGSNYTYGAIQTILYNPFNWWNTTTMFALYHFDMKVDPNLTFESKLNKGWSSQFYTNQVFLLNQDKTFQAEFTLYASSKSYRQFDIIDSYYKLDIGVRMQLLDNKLQLTAKLNDIFKSSSSRSTTYTNDVKQEYYNDYDSRYFTLGLSYKFGNSNITVSERDKGNIEELNRVN